MPGRALVSLPDASNQVAYQDNHGTAPSSLLQSPRNQKLCGCRFLFVTVYLHLRESGSSGDLNFGEEQATYIFTSDSPR